MKKRFTRINRIVLGALLLSCSSNVSAQVLNDAIDYRSRVEQYFYFYDSEVGDDEPTYVFYLKDSNFDSWTDGITNIIGMPDGVHYETNTNPDRWLIGVTNVNFNTTLELELVAYEEDGDYFSGYDPGVDEHYYTEFATFTGSEPETSITNGGLNKPSTWSIAHNTDNVNWIFPWASNWNIQLATAWRFNAGDDCGNPLQFGTLGANDIVNHTNSNSRAILETVNDDGNFLAYSDYEGEASADVYYSFTITEPLEVTISTVNAGTDFDTYVKLWNDGDCLDTDNLITVNDDAEEGGTTASKIIRVLEPGTYHVMVEGYGGNEGTFELTIETGNSTANLSENSTLAQLTVYPNPASENVTFSLANEISKGQITLANSLGQVVYNAKLANQTTYTMDVSELEPGLYFATIEENDQKIVEKLIIE